MSAQKDGAIIQVIRWIMSMSRSGTAVILGHDYTGELEVIPDNYLVTVVGGTSAARLELARKVVETLDNRGLLVLESLVNPRPIFIMTPDLCCFRLGNFPDSVGF